VEKWSRAALAVSVTQFILITSLELCVMTSHLNQTAKIYNLHLDATMINKANNLRALTVYHSLFCVGQLFQFILCIDTVFIIFLLFSHITIFQLFFFFLSASLFISNASYFNLQLFFFLLHL